MSAEGDTNLGLSSGVGIPPGLSDRQLLEMIWLKLAKVEQVSEKVDKIDARMSSFESKIVQLEIDYEDLHKGTSFIEHDVQELKQTVSEIKNEMVSKDEFEKLQSEVINNSNRMRRKNVVFYNIPERVEGDDCTGYINALANKIDESIDIEEAHRSPTYTTNLESGKQPRPIHALCFRRQHRKLILEKGPSFFKENLINDKRISVSDDVHPATRLIHKRLLEKQKEFRQRGWFAFIPWTVPRRLKYRPGPKCSKTPMKTFLLQS